MSLRLVLVLVLLGGCADTEGVFGDSGVQCQEGETRCSGAVWDSCQGGRWISQDCAASKQTCIDKLGCRLCDPGTKFCVGQDAFSCSADGTKQTKIKTCRPDQQCALGECFDFCDLPQGRSNVGCEFWAVDLPNEYYCLSVNGGATCAMYGCAACQQFAVVAANTSGFEVTVQVDINEAAVGSSAQIKTVTKQIVKGHTVQVINLPMREVDCSQWYTDTAGKLRRKGNSQTCLSAQAYRLKASYPIVMYQFNPILNDYSNGASLLIPTNGLDRDYYVMGWSTTNPIAIPMPGQVIEGIPDCTNVTVVGTEASTKVDVTLTHPTQASADGKIPAAKKGDTITVNLNPFEVLNINSIQALGSMTGDLTGSMVKASKPVVVFSGAARASVPGFPLDSYNPKPPEPSGEYKVCCTEHFEQQMFPISSLGTDFVVTRTPIRSTSSIIEPDFYRVLATKDKTLVTTNLSEFPQLMLNQGGVADFWAVKGFTLQSNEPIMVAQYAVAQGFLDQYKVGGDPEFVMFPPVEQYRKDYVFLTPPTFTKDYVVIGLEANTVVQLDGKEVTGEFKTECQEFSIGKLDGKDYFSLHCPVQDGIHTITATLPVGIMVYGYYGVGSYGYPGGADVKQINIE